METEKGREKESNMPAFKRRKLSGIELAGWKNGGFLLEQSEKDEAGKWSTTKLSLSPVQFLILHHRVVQAYAWVNECDKEL